MIINIGTSYLSFSQVYHEKSAVLTIKIMGEERGSVSFEAKDTRDKKIKIGRGITCDVRLDDTLLSKLHATIFYNSNGWNLIDGDMQKSSTNGTWLYLSEYFQMYNSMIFKSNSSVFQVTSIASTT
jgi:pSer/pThr/pTyr-binding forkhead associated (FHA) protein